MSDIPGQLDLVEYIKQADQELADLLDELEADGDLSELLDDLDGGEVAF